MNIQQKNLSKSLVAALQKVSARYVKDGGGSASMTVASYNVHKCIGVDKFFDPERVAAVIREIDADIIALQEADERFGRRTGLLDLDRLRRDTGLVAVEPPRYSQGHGWHGNVLLVRDGEILNVEHLKLPGVEPRGALVVDIERMGVEFRVIAAHLGLLRHSRALQALHLLEHAVEDGRPTILLGDLNEWRVGRRSSLGRLLPEFGPIEAAIPSFPSRFPLLALDRILASPYELISTIETHDSPAARVASDHLPLKARIDLGAG